jgi:hypothetical protein
VADKLTSDIPTRLTGNLDGDVCRFGAMTATASAPQRGLPLDPLAARDFAKRLYSGLLGLGGAEVEPMHVAMREARIEIFKKEDGVRTWGAYQHYGNPCFRCFR